MSCHGSLTNSTKSIMWSHFCCLISCIHSCRSSRLVALHARDGFLLVPPGHPVHWCEAERLLGDVHPPHCHPCSSHSQLEQPDAPDGLPCPHGARPGWPLDGAGQAVQICRIRGEITKIFKLSTLFSGQRCCDIAFVIFCLTWTYSRIGIFPTWIIYSTTSEAAQVLTFYFPP